METCQGHSRNVENVRMDSIWKSIVLGWVIRLREGQWVGELWSFQIENVSPVGRKGTFPGFVNGTLVSLINPFSVNGAGKKIMLVFVVQT
jgi:hypothetical protein